MLFVYLSSVVSDDSSTKIDAAWSRLTLHDSLVCCAQNLETPLSVSMATFSLRCHMKAIHGMRPPLTVKTSKICSRLVSVVLWLNIILHEEFSRCTEFKSVDFLPRRRRTQCVDRLLGKVGKSNVIYWRPKWPMCRSEGVRRRKYREGILFENGTQEWFVRFALCGNEQPRYFHEIMSPDVE